MQQMPIFGVQGACAPSAMINYQCDLGGTKQKSYVKHDNHRI